MGYPDTTCLLVSHFTRGRQNLRIASARALGPVVLDLDLTCIEKQIIHLHGRDSADGHFWTALLFRGRSSQAGLAMAEEEDRTPGIPIAATALPSWADSLPKSELVDLFRQADFGSTELGDISEWPLSLRNYCFMVFTDSRAACVYEDPLSSLDE